MIELEFVFHEKFNKTYENSVKTLLRHLKRLKNLLKSLNFLKIWLKSRKVLKNSVKSQKTFTKFKCLLTKFSKILKKMYSSI